MNFPLFSLYLINKKKLDDQSINMFNKLNCYLYYRIRRVYLNGKRRIFKIIAKIN